MMRSSNRHKKSRIWNGAKKKVKDDNQKPRSSAAVSDWSTVFTGDTHARHFNIRASTNTTVAEMTEAALDAFLLEGVSTDQAVAGAWIRQGRARSTSRGEMT